MAPYWVLREAGLMEPVNKECIFTVVVKVTDPNPAPRSPGNEPSPLGSVESFNPGKRRWEYLAPMPTARCSSAAVQTPSMLLVIGGVAQGPSDAVEALCVQENA
ncbi:hypothetical protein NHX12_013405 [Muraenolepis orangiensis]|uniref:Uncharacterized protein n=1 Tax=Muraenolepis orangiensis TaxID=630683 RepID=A0A9Q0DDR5_9TELE|nr:hypothetical protein NHX12_013405 [Muraenolepis orangiensis]